ncbi:MAG: hypothetical protein ACRYFX_23590 [Janthinobacterium lividum]
MKVILTAALIALVSLAARPAAASSQDPERATPSSTKAKHLAARPLVHYLAATLQLSTSQTLAVQQALKVNPLQLRTPEQIAERLQPVLTTAEFDRFKELTNNVTTYEFLNSLATR